MFPTLELNAMNKYLGTGPPRAKRSDEQRCDTATSVDGVAMSHDTLLSCASYDFIDFLTRMRNAKQASNCQGAGE